MGVQALRGMIRRLSGSLLVARQLCGQRRIPFLPRDKIEALRDRRVRSIVQFAARHVAFYRQWFADNRVDPRSIRTAGDLERLPLLEKAQLQAEPRRFVADCLRYGMLFHTSGSTGRPLEVWHDRRSLLANIAYGEREREPLIRLCRGAFRPKELHVSCEASTLNKVAAFYAENIWRPITSRRVTIPVTLPLETIIETINRYQPDVLVSYGEWISLFFRTLAARQIPSHLPKTAVYVSETLARHEREWIEQKFGVPVLSRYNAAECFKIGYFCEERRGFHIHEDICHVRICDERGHTVTDGQTGRIVISNLVNRGTVLLNYCLGDYGSFSLERCPCGRTFRLLSEVVGRVHDILVLADGRLLHPLEVTQVLKVERDVLQYQLVQQQPREFTLRLVTVDEQAFQRAKMQIPPRLQALLGSDARIDVQRQAEFPREPAGKFRAIVSCCRPPS